VACTSRCEKACFGISAFGVCKIAVGANAKL
jgi:hypothetical protein